MENDIVCLLTWLLGPGGGRQHTRFIESTHPSIHLFSKYFSEVSSVPNTVLSTEG